MAVIYPDGRVEREYYCQGCGLGRVGRPGQLCGHCDADAKRLAKEPRRGNVFWILVGVVVMAFILSLAL